MPFRTAGECLPVLQPVPNPFPMVQDILLTSSNRLSPIRTVPYLLFSFPAELLPVIGQQGVIQRLDRFRPRYLPQVLDNMKSVRDAAALFQVRRRALYPRRPSPRIVISGLSYTVWMYSLISLQGIPYPVNTRLAVSVLRFFPPLLSLHIHRPAAAAGCFPAA